MKFTKEFLQDLNWGSFRSNKEVEIIEDEIVETSRWSVHYRMVFKFEDKFYVTYYSRGATESQDESPYEYDDDEIECQEVFPVTKTVTVYE